MGIAAYNAKRDFSKTPEPKGRRAKAGEGGRYLIQKHAARRLHYDLRLELDGVLKSWAVTRGPSLVPGDKRLAVEVEDHPLDYGNFEGTIPKGQYGGGTVMLWDTGSWKPDGDPRRGLKKGHLEFEIVGEKLKGRWHLVRMAGKAGEKRTNWLLIKGEDAFARAEGDPDLLEEATSSVKSGRSMDEIAAGKEPKARRKAAAAKAAPMPGFIEPQLATLKHATPAGDRWLHEIKFDGYRLQAHLDCGKLRLLTRSGLDWTGRFGKSVRAAFEALPAKQAIVDGELVVETGSGGSDFSVLQAALSEGRSDGFVFYAFDLLHLDGQDLRDEPLEQRKQALAGLLKGAKEPLRLSEHFDEGGEMVLRHACRLSLEGIVSKKRDAPYRSGRSDDWIKSKCTDRQEFIIAGYAPSTVSTKRIGSLALGYFSGGNLQYAGRVGTGFSQRQADELFGLLSPLVREQSPFAKALPAAERRNLRFVEPELVGEVEFRNWTADGVLRHASFRGLREDKPAAEIVREEAMDDGKSQSLPRHTVKLTHPDRIYWKDAGVTKAGLAEYYAGAWRRMAPHVVGRPLALLRCPGGTDAQCFFQKHAWKGQSRQIATFSDPQDDSGEPLLAIRDFDGLIGLVQGGSLEIHAWQSTVDDLERPDRIVMDLDPGDGVPWSRVTEAASEVRQRLEAAGLAAFLKTTGGKGLHVVSPLKPGADWETVKGFAKAMAEAMAADSPDRYVSVVSKAKRKGRILVDYLRNGRGATAVVPYSTRARAGATVAMPLAWNELGPDIKSDHFTVENAVARLGETDPWADFDDAAAPLEPRGRKR